MIINKLIFGVFLFFVLYYYSDRKNLSWCLYGVGGYVIILIIIEYLNKDNKITVNNEIEKSLEQFTQINNDYLADQQNLITKHNLGQQKISEQTFAGKKPVIVEEEQVQEPKAFNYNENIENKLNRNSKHIDKLDQLKSNPDIEQYFKSKINNIQVFNSDQSYAPALDNADAYKYNVNNKLFYSMFDHSHSNF